MLVSIARARSSCRSKAEVTELHPPFKKKRPSQAIQQVTCHKASGMSITRSNSNNRMEMRSSGDFLIFSQQRIAIVCQACHVDSPNQSGCAEATQVCKSLMTSHSHRRSQITDEQWLNKQQVLSTHVLSQSQHATTRSPSAHLRCARHRCLGHPITQTSQAFQRRLPILVKLKACLFGFSGAEKFPESCHFRNSFLHDRHMPQNRVFFKTVGLAKDNLEDLTCGSSEHPVHGRSRSSTTELGPKRHVRSVLRQQAIHRPLDTNGRGRVWLLLQSFIICQVDLVEGNQSPHFCSLSSVTSRRETTGQPACI